MLEEIEKLLGTVLIRYKQLKNPTDEEIQDFLTDNVYILDIEFLANLLEILK